MTKWTKRFWVITVIYTILLLVSIIVFQGEYDNCTDVKFLFNRLEQMYGCIQDGNVPYFYYNDFEGVGYGTPFFYGQLTLYPFLWLVPYGIRTFARVYITATILLTFFGVRYFCKIYTRQCTFIAILVTFGEFYFQMFILSALLTNMFAVGISFFFLGECVKIFKKNGNCIKGAILFFILLNTHLLTSVLSFIICVCMMLYYFDKKKLREYVKFALITCVCCSYTIMNFVYHSDVLSNIGSIGELAAESVKDISAPFYINDGIFGGYILQLIRYNFGGVIRNTVMNLFILGVAITSFTSRHRTLKQRVIWLLCFVSFYIAQYMIFSCFNTPLQYPVRYIPYALTAFFVLSFRYVKLKDWKIWLSILSLLPMLILGGMTFSVVDIDNSLESYQVMGGEYLSSDFVWNYDTFCEMRNGGWADFTEDSGKVTVTLDGTEGYEFYFPKLYYRGYVCSGGFEVEPGYSQFCLIHPDGYIGELTLQYIHPWFLKIMGVVSYGFVLYLIIYLLQKTDWDNIILKVIESLLHLLTLYY